MCFRGGRASPKSLDLAAATVNYKERKDNYPDPAAVVVVEKSAKAIRCHKSILLKIYVFYVENCYSHYHIMLSVKKGSHFLSNFFERVCALKASRAFGVCRVSGRCPGDIAGAMHPK